MADSKLEALLALHMKALKFPAADREVRFHPKRKWRFDFAWPDLMLAVEVEGGVYSKGRHTRGKGFEEDCRKYGQAMLLGWTVYRCTGGMVHSGEATETIGQLIKQRQAESLTKVDILPKGREVLNG